MTIEQRADNVVSIAPAAMTKLDRHRIVAELAEQPFDVFAGVGRLVEAGRKLREQGAEPATCRQRLDAAFELIDVLARDRALIVGHQRVRELLVELDGEVEVRRRALDPTKRRGRPRLAVKCAVHLDAVEPLGIEAELVEATIAIFRIGIEDAVPGAAAGGIVPAGRADAQVHAGYTNRSAFAVRFSPCFSQGSCFPNRYRRSANSEPRIANRELRC